MSSRYGSDHDEFAYTRYPPPRYPLSYQSSNVPSVGSARRSEPLPLHSSRSYDREPSYDDGGRYQMQRPPMHSDRGRDDARSENSHQREDWTTSENYRDRRECRCCKYGCSESCPPTIDDDFVKVVKDLGITMKNPLPKYLSAKDLSAYIVEMKYMKRQYEQATLSYVTRKGLLAPPGETYCIQPTCHYAENSENPFIITGVTRHKVDQDLRLIGEVPDPRRGPFSQPSTALVLASREIQDHPSINRRRRDGYK